MKKSGIVKRVLLGLLALAVVAIVAFVGFYFTRFQTIASVEQLTDYDDGYDLYMVDIKYQYDLERMMKSGFKDNQMVADAILSEALPLLPIHMESPDYGCSSFNVADTEGNILTGRNYDFEADTSAIMVRCAPKGGYKSIAMAALDHVGVREIGGFVDQAFTLPAPFICLDGMNEKGVSIVILWVDSEPTMQDTEKPDLFTTLAVRLVLDRAASTQEAVDLLKGYDMFAVSGGDYHFFIADASGDSRVVEYDCHSETRELIDTPVRTTTNFYQLYIDKVLPNQYNGIYGHGRERYDAIEEVLTANEGSITKDTVWEALMAAQQLPKPDSITSNTQWSVIYDNTNLTADIVVRRNWGDIVHAAIG